MLRHRPYKNQQQQQQQQRHASIIETTLKINNAAPPPRPRYIIPYKKAVQPPTKPLYHLKMPRHCHQKPTIISNHATAADANHQNPAAAAAVKTPTKKQKWSMQ